MPRAKIGWKATIRKKLTKKDAHYSGGLVAGAKMLELFGDAATELCLRESNRKDEGLFRAYQSVEFLKPVYSGDTVEVTATIIKVGNTSRTMKFTACKLKPKRQLATEAAGTVVLPSLKNSLNKS